MRVLLGFLGLFATAICSANAAVLIPVVPVPGSTETDVFGINDSNTIVGSYFTSDGVEHGFFGSLDGNYTTFDFDASAAPGTVPRSINNFGDIVGYANASTNSFNKFVEFERFADGSMKPIKNRHVTLNGIAQGINNRPVPIFVGDYYYANPNTSLPGYYGANAKYKGAVLPPSSAYETAPRGINNSRTIVGFFYARPLQLTQQGFIIENGVSRTVMNPDPSAVDTSLEGVNDKGVATGYWEDQNYTGHGFYWNSKSNTFTPINVPGSADTWPNGMNNAGLIALLTDTGSFIFCPKAKRNCPSGGTEIPDSTPVQGRSRMVDSGLYRNASRALPERAPMASGPVRRPIP